MKHRWRFSRAPVKRIDLLPMATRSEPHPSRPSAFRVRCGQGITAAVKRMGVAIETARQAIKRWRLPQRAWRGAVTVSTYAAVHGRTLARRMIGNLGSISPLIVSGLRRVFTWCRTIRWRPAFPADPLHDLYGLAPDLLGSTGLSEQRHRQVMTELEAANRRLSQQQRELASIVLQVKQIQILVEVQQQALLDLVSSLESRRDSVDASEDLVKVGAGPHHEAGKRGDV